MEPPASRPNARAAVLRYRPLEDPAPKLVAKGTGYLAERILELARVHNVPIRQDKNLVQVLSALDLDEEIPASAYQAVVEILAFVYRQSQTPTLLAGEKARREKTP